MEAQFKKPLRKRNDEPPGLDAFAAGAPRPFPEPPTLQLTPDRPREPEYGMNVRFSESEKAVILELSRREDRSQQQIVKRLLAPAIAAAAARLAAEPAPEVSRLPSLPPFAQRA